VGKAADPVRVWVKNLQTVGVQSPAVCLAPRSGASLISQDNDNIPDLLGEDTVFGT
jgi:hypothetical protein